MVIHRHGREEGAGSTKGNAVPEETSDAVKRKGSGVHGFGRRTYIIVHVKGVQASKLPEGDVFDQVLPLNGHVECPWPSRGPEQGPELVLVVRLSHEHLSPTEAAAYHA